MIARVVAWCTRRHWIVIAAALVLASAGELARRSLSRDAIPDLSDSQVIVFSEWPGRSPTLVEDQVTYPIVSAMLSASR